MTMKVARLASGIGLWVCFTACAAQPSPEPNAPTSSAGSRATKTAAAEEQAVAPESLPAAGAPAPLAARDGLDASKAQRPGDEVELSTLEAAERALNQAKADLDRLALAEPAPVVGHNAAADRAAEKKESRATKAPSAAGAAAPSNASGLCESACRAFSSLSRAANAVCRLDGDSGAHCTR